MEFGGDRIRTRDFRAERKGEHVVSVVPWRGRSARQNVPALAWSNPITCTTLGSSRGSL